MDNSTILAWIFTSLLLIVGTMLFKNSWSTDRKSLSSDSCGTRKKILIVGNNVFDEIGSDCARFCFQRTNRNVMCISKILLLSLYLFGNMICWGERSE